MTYIVGDSVVIHQKIEESDSGCVLWKGDGVMDDLIGKSGIVYKVDRAFVTVQFKDGSLWNFLPECFDNPKNICINDVIDNYNPRIKAGEVGDTVIYQAQRRKEGQRQYVIKYGDTKASNGVVKQKDLLGLAALLIKIATNDQKEVVQDEPVPF